MKFTSLTPDEFKDYVEQHFSHYTQSTDLYQYRIKHNKGVHLVGVKEAGKVIAACLLTDARALKVFKYFYTHRGPVMDYSNLELVNFFFKNLTRYVRRRRGIYILVDPYVLEHLRTADGEIIERFNNKQWFKVMKRLGYQHQGFTTGYSDMSQIRWHSILDLKDKTEQQILKDMSYQTRRNILKTLEMDVEVKTLTINETNRFYRLFHMAEEKHGFHFQEEPYFKQMLEIYGNRACIKLAYIDLNKYLRLLKNKIVELEATLNELKKSLETNSNSKKNKTKYQQLTQQLESICKKVAKTEQLIVTDGTLLDLAAALFIYNNHEMYYLSSGSNPKYNEFMGAYRLQWDMILFAKEKGIPRYNFYGITGEFGENAEDYGVQQFKKGFNAFVEEYVGDFIKPVNKFLYKLYKK
ncbi:FmhC protein [Staphylococcus petrasii]|uniref:Aminoacyltransferase FemA n=1 Tax=Staphylococcus petrasii TaxID=1276936 RepID=A0A380G228_9STAP|nr:aminoacyltransferase [Staphylococcus petrasii]PNZ25070.1 aminoacyltransferase [Staphylococcus petrasii]TGE12494.1 aminoacyltransferase [Staphylococcus petrasii]TGE17296.1 aminoacyltransferase [Staphylococcus petrasii]SUM44400.1 FmhC protein [Staphylococcus petrasii]